MDKSLKLDLHILNIKLSGRWDVMDKDWELWRRLPRQWEDYKLQMIS